MSTVLASELILDLRPDARRDSLLAIQDDSIVRRVGAGPLRWQDFFGAKAVSA